MKTYRTTAGTIVLHTGTDIITAKNKKLFDATSNQVEYLISRGSLEPIEKVTIL